MNTFHTPDVFRQLLTAQCIHPYDIASTEDGFHLVKKSVSDILAEKEIFDFPDSAGRPGIVHRLDKDTSGCLVIAKTPEAMFKLGQAFAEHTAKKCYLAICRGVPAETSGTLTNLIGRHPVNRQKMAIVEQNGKEAITSYQIITAKTVEKIPLALAKVNIATGRTHQIRVHMASLNLPVAGDELYGRNTGFPGVTRQQLHAWKLALPHPETGEMMEFSAPVPEDMTALLAKLNVKVK